MVFRIFKSKMKLFCVVFPVVLSSCSSNFGTKASAKPITGNYIRKDWNHWTDRDENCFNTRHEILKARSEIPIKFKKKGKTCYLESGMWSDYYFPESLNSPKDIDIDHIVPLKHAHDIGGNLWSPELKEKFANDPENLVITYKKYNRQKGAKIINEWLPLNFAYACKYYKDWMKIKAKYKLPVSDEEKNAVDLKLCPNSGVQNY